MTLEGEHKYSDHSIDFWGPGLKQGWFATEALFVDFGVGQAGHSFFENSR